MSTLKTVLSVSIIFSFYIFGTISCPRLSSSNFIAETYLFSFLFIAYAFEVMIMHISYDFLHLI